MLPSLFTAFFFSLSSVCASRSTKLIGPIKANFYRLIFAFLCLAAYAYLLGQGHRGPGLPWFIISGVIGVGVADTFTFLAIKRIGPRLSTMLVQCFTAPFGAVVELLWLGTKLTQFQVLGIAVVLGGSILALLPERKITIPLSALRTGAIFGLTGAFGQAIGAVITRKANAVNDAVYITVNGTTAAYQRIIGAVIVGIVIYALAELFQRRRPNYKAIPHSIYRKAAPWTIANATAGLVLGVSCYQWALQGTATGIVLAIVATAPLMIMPLAYFLDGDRPSWRALLGGAIAVFGVIIIQVWGNLR